jgi:hypothetical protein
MPRGWKGVLRQAVRRPSHKATAGRKTPTRDNEPCRDTNGKANEAISLRAIGSHIAALFEWAPISNVAILNVISDLAHALPVFKP